MARVGSLRASGTGSDPAIWPPRSVRVEPEEIEVLFRQVLEDQFHGRPAIGGSRDSLGRKAVVLRLRLEFDFAGGGVDHESGRRSVDVASEVETGRIPPSGIDRRVADQIISVDRAGQDDADEGENQEGGDESTEA